MGVAASANGAIVEGRGHVIKDVASLPLVVSDAISGLTKTRDAVEMLKNLKLGAELQKVKDSKTITCGKGKFRGRRYTRKTGLLLVHDQKSLPAFANIEGVELANVEHLNLLRLCPGGKLGRLILWTEGAFKRLESLFSNESKRGFEIPEKMVSCSDLDEYFYSPEIQSLITTPDLLPKGTCKKSAAEKKSVERAIAMW
ncbi:LSU ribosomal protein L1E [Enterospora canceri]|uniref:LSU ribosomal protein L1E n=1 Tax=Enterospora canceri TaxID=1081671 RepID=A0A1Y1S9F6_9MICR|nr:LSU ribosomal protein L1E [Enterospora canceri]